MPAYESMNGCPENFLRNVTVGSFFIEKASAYLLDKIVINNVLKLKNLETFMQARFHIPETTRIF